MKQPLSSELSQTPSTHKYTNLTSPRNLALLLLLTLLVISGTLLTQHLLPTKHSIPPLSYSGPFASLPLTTNQVDALHHLRSHLSNKELASLYVARMSLDEELGQLIMVEYNDDHY